LGVVEGFTTGRDGGVETLGDEVLLPDPEDELD